MSEIMLCLRCEDGAPSCPAGVQKCGWCGKDVWIAHASHKAAIDLCAKIKCMQCHVQWLDETNPPQDEVKYHALTTSEEWKEFMEWGINQEKWNGH